jgi:cytochrome c2
MKNLIALALFTTTLAAQAVPFADGNADTGKKMFDDYKCNSCHKGLVGGDGSKVFTRPNRQVSNPKELVERIVICSGNVGAKLSEQDKQHLAAYLNKNYYQFK